MPITPTVAAAAVALARRAGCSRAWMGAGRIAVRHTCPEGSKGLKTAMVGVLNPFLAYVCSQGGLPALEKVYKEACGNVASLSPEEAIKEAGRVAKGKMKDRQYPQYEPRFEPQYEEPPARPRPPRRVARQDDPLPGVLMKLDYRKAEIDAAIASGSVPEPGEASIEERMRAAITIMSGQKQTPAVAGLDFGSVFTSRRW